MITKQEISDEFMRFLSWETESFDGWETVEIFTADTLSDAWILARPNDAGKFLDLDFKDMVDSANGKWLEKESPDDTYKIILSCSQNSSLVDLTKVLVHEMRHCLDYQAAVKDLHFEKYCSGNRYYNNWSEFRAEYFATRYEYFSLCHDIMKREDKFLLLAGILGRNSADATTGLLWSRGNKRDILYYISRYIGVSRAIRNLNMEEKVDAAVFHLWTMTPTTITEEYGTVFYIGNEWDEMKTCRLDAIPQTCYYYELLHRIEEQQKE